MSSVRHHCQGGHRQHCALQFDVVVTEAASPVGREGIADSTTTRRLLEPKADGFSKIVGGALRGEFRQEGKVQPSLRSGQSTSQRYAGISVWVQNRQLMAQIAKYAIRDDTLISGTTTELRWRDRAAIPSPRVAVTRPLRMQSARTGERSPDGHTGIDKSLTQVGEKRRRLGSTEPLAH